MSHPAYLSPCVETELICILNVVRSAFFVVTFPVYSIRCPPKAIFTIIVSSLCRCTSTMMCEYVIVHRTCILFFATKRIVFVTFSIFLEICLQVVQIPLIIRFARGLLLFFPFDWIISLYCSMSLVSVSITVFTRYQVKGSY